MSWEITPAMAILWCFYPVGILIFIEFFLNDDDDNDRDGGVMSPVYQRY
jgi:hypothetical protein|tara:strand:+ start:140 stop:286 length:147 start_codon:yes stop_codon:yes gene_type:complete